MNDRYDFYESGLNKLAEEIKKIMADKGFESPRDMSDNNMVGAKLMMIVTELAEAMEAVRDNDEANFSEELADTIIRILHLCGSMEIDISLIVSDKMKINMARPYRHGHGSGV